MHTSRTTRRNFLKTTALAGGIVLAGKDTAAAVRTQEPASVPQRRSCYINFAEHLLNAFNPNMLYPGLSYPWSDEAWRHFIDMIGDFGFTHFEFWLVPRLFSPQGLEEPFGKAFADQMNRIIAHGAKRGVGVKMITALTTVGEKWHTHCPNVPAEWAECRVLWDEWTQRLDGLSVIGIFPGDPGGCSRNGCTAQTFIDRSIEIAEIIKRNQPQAQIELGTWGTPFWGWGTIQGPPGWQGEFIPSIQGTAWKFDKKRADESMDYLVKRLKDFPEHTSIAINLGFNSDSDPDAENGLHDARGWAREIAKTNPIVTWDFSLTEGEGAILPHYRFERLFAQRRREREAAPYRGGICFTMTPMLNQLSLYQSAQSFLNPDGDYTALTKTFYERLFGPDARKLADLLPLFEIMPDWGNRVKIDITRAEFNQKMHQGSELVRALEGRENTSAPFHPSVDEYRKELLFFFEFMADLSGASPDFAALEKRYWDRVFAIYDHLPDHVDPRPRGATQRLVNFFNPNADRGAVGPLPVRWTQ